MNLARSRRHGRGLLPLLARPGAVLRFLRDRRAPLAPKLGLIFAALYVIWPLDLIPDVAPVVTWLDDLGVVAVATTWIATRAARWELKVLEEEAGREAAPGRSLPLEERG